MVNDAVSAVGSASSERSATTEALQQALLGGMANDPSPSTVSDAADTPAAAATVSIADTWPDAPSALVALAARTQPSRRSAGPDHPEPTMTTPSSPAQEASATDPRLVAVSAPAVAEHTTSLLATPALLTALQAGQMQPLWAHLTETRTKDRQANAQREEGSASNDDTGDDDPDDSPHHTPDATPATQESPPTTWQAQLSAELQRHTVGAPLLNLAFAQWARGRVVLIVSPRGTAWGERAWLHALRWPPGAPTLVGDRFEARLQWHRRTDPAQWWGVRTTKQQGLHLGRQLRVQAELPEEDTLLAPGEAPAIELWLGAAAANDRPHARVLDVRIDAIARLWASLEPQWSVTVLASSQPLGEGAP